MATGVERGRGTRRGARTKARKRALDLLFEAEARGIAVEGLLAERLAEARARAGERGPSQPTIGPYAVELVEGVVARGERIDELLATYSQGWTLDRMPAVDRAILRLATWELLFNDEVPDAVVIDEAVDLARDLSTDASPTFVNGLLSRLLDVKPGLLHN